MFWVNHGALQADSSWQSLTYRPSLTYTTDEPFTAGNILSSNAVNLQLLTHTFRVCFPYYLYCCYANYRFLSLSSHLVEFQVCTCLSLDVWNHHVVLTLSSKLSFSHLYLLFYGRWYGQAAATATAVLLFRQTYLGIRITSTSASRFLRLFNVLCNLLHVLDVSWSSGYCGTRSGNLLGIFNVHYW